MKIKKEIGFSEQEFNLISEVVENNLDGESFELFVRQACLFMCADIKNKLDQLNKPSNYDQVDHEEIVTHLRELDGR